MYQWHGRSRSLKDDDCPTVIVNDTRILAGMKPLTFATAMSITTTKYDGTVLRVMLIQPISSLAPNTWLQP
jgi:hypothetical protein